MEQRGQFTGARIPDPGFADDDGAPDPLLSSALTTYATDRSAYPEVLMALTRSRVLVPVVALLGEVEYDEAGLAHDKSSDMAAVLMQGRDGRQALLAFTGTTTLEQWNPEARPVPVTARVAAQSALQDGAAALLLDIAGPVPCVVSGEHLTGLAAGWQLARVADQLAWIRPGTA